MIPCTAFAVVGGIESGFHTTKVCHDNTCTTPTPGELNFRPTGATAVTVDDVTGLSGDVWGNELGWITLNPTGEGVIFANTGTGLLTGKAWSQVSGWINFAPTGQSVTIDPSTGEFSGWAWTGGPYGGWIKFDCSDASTCIKTNWNGSSGSISGGSAPDACSNLEGYQFQIPARHTVDEEGNCIVIIDACPNIVGVQSIVPTGFVRNNFEACIPYIDHCPNISGTQTTVPSGYSIVASGNCVSSTLDSCPDIAGIQSSAEECKEKDQCLNISGVQAEVPAGYDVVERICYFASIDVCKNIEGNQYVFPEGTMLTDSGECVPLPDDFCNNLGGIQERVPEGFYSDNGNCFFGAPPEKITSEEAEVIAFSFIPEKAQIPVENDFLNTIVKEFHLNSKDVFKVDAVSSLAIAAGILFLLHLLLRVVRLFL